MCRGCDDGRGDAYVGVTAARGPISGRAAETGFLLAGQPVILAGLRGWTLRFPVVDLKWAWELVDMSRLKTRPHPDDASLLPGRLVLYSGSTAGLCFRDEGSTAAVGFDGRRRYPTRPSPADSRAGAYPRPPAACSPVNGPATETLATCWHRGGPPDQDRAPTGPMGKYRLDTKAGSGRNSK